MALLTIPEAASRRGCSRQTVYSGIQNRKLVQRPDGLIDDSEPRNKVWLDSRVKGGARKQRRKAEKCKVKAPIMNPKILAHLRWQKETGGILEDHQGNIALPVAHVNSPVGYLLLEFARDIINSIGVKSLQDPVITKIIDVHGRWTSDDGKQYSAWLSSIDSTLLSKTQISELTAPDETGKGGSNAISNSINDI